MFGAMAWALSLTAGTAAGADFEAGWKAYQQGDFAAAMAEWRPLAEEGHARAQFNMGILYDDGRGVERSRDMAIEWWTQAAAQGLPVAHLMHIDTPDGKPNVEGAIRWLEKAADSGFVRSLYTLGKIYADGVGVPVDEEKAFKLLLAAGQGGLDRAQYNLGKMYRDGRGVAADPAESAKWYEQAAAQGYGKAQNKLAIIYGKGRGVKEDLVESLKWAILAARQGNQEAEENRALLTQRMSAEQIAMAEQEADNFKPIKANP
jgi:TPR repeat protein